jgi:hypothetical protein
MNVCGTHYRKKERQRKEDGAKEESFDKIV